MSTLDRHTNETSNDYFVRLMRTIHDNDPATAERFTRTLRALAIPEEIDADGIAALIAEEPDAEWRAQLEDMFAKRAVRS